MLGHRARAAAGSLTAAAVLALPIAGCGGETTETYAKDYKQAATEFRQSIEKASRQRQSPALSERVPAARSFRAAVDRLAKNLDGLEPPDDISKLNDRAVAALEKMSADLRRLEEAAAANDRGAVQQLAPRLQVDQAELQGVLDQIDQKVTE